MYDVLVIGGGHAGVEAAAAASRIGVHVGLITFEKDALARLSCNPAMGGTAKGQLIKEVDAFGGLMAIATDLSAIQYRMLNRSKGPAVWSPRAQVDRETYTKEIVNLFSERYPSIDIIEDEAVGIVAENNAVSGVICRGKDNPIAARNVILCSGTFLRGLCHVGDYNWSSGRFDENPSNDLSDWLASAGFPLLRFKTGTPPRVIKDSIDFSKFEEQPSDEDHWFFSNEISSRVLPQHVCWRTRTVPESHAIIRNNIVRSPLFNGSIQSTGPRYCPSIEDKVVRFPEREQQHIIFEPEGIGHPWLYVNGFSSSLPEDVQIGALRVIPGCEDIEFGRPGYAIEYDVIPTSELKPTLETRRLSGLYLAGQICGTSGYEEAAVQGIVAAVNAAHSVTDKREFRLKRSDGYTGVLIDDLCTLSINEPYRMFTSRAEYRLLLRQDNAEERLHSIAYDYGLIPRERFEQIQSMLHDKQRWIERLHSVRIPRGMVCANDRDPERVESAAHLLTRSDVTLSGLLDKLDGTLSHDLPSNQSLLNSVETEITYSGYLDRQKREIQRLQEQEEKIIPDNIDFSVIPGISSEARQKLMLHKPATLGMASRIAGITPSDLAILLVYLKKHYYLLNHS